MIVYAEQKRSMSLRASAHTGSQSPEVCASPWGIATGLVALAMTAFLSALNDHLKREKAARLGSFLHYFVIFSCLTL